MKRRFITLTMILVLMVGLLAGCGKTDTTGDGTSDKLVVYSPNSEDIINLIIPMFEKETGIKVELISAGTGELLKRIESEKENPYADVMFGGSHSQFAQLTNMLLAMGGDYESDEGWDYVAKLIENLDGKVASGSGAAHKSVADGEYIVALTYEDPSAAYVRDGA